MTDNAEITPVPGAPEAGATAPPEPPKEEEAVKEAGKEASKETKEAVAVSPPPPPKTDWARVRMQERIDKLTAQKAAGEAEIAKLRAGQSQDSEKLQQEVDKLATQKAQVEAAKMASWNMFNESLNKAISEGKKEYGTEKFDKSVATLNGIYKKAGEEGDTETSQRYLTMLQAVLDTEAAPKLIQFLGEDPNEVARILGLPSPARMGVELGKLAVREIESVSGAPKPITPISGVGRNHVAISAEDPERSDGLDMRVWMERRNKHVSEVNKTAGRRVIP